jgi:hypothetical protein
VEDPVGQVKAVIVVPDRVIERDEHLQALVPRRRRERHFDVHRPLGCRVAIEGKRSVEGFSSSHRHSRSYQHPPCKRHSRKRGPSASRMRSSDTVDNRLTDACGRVPSELLERAGLASARGHGASRPSTRPGRLGAGSRAPLSVLPQSPAEVGSDDRAERAGVLASSGLGCAVDRGGVLTLITASALATSRGDHSL